MLDHLIGKPSANWRRLQALLLLVGGYHLCKISHRYNFINPFIVKWNKKLGKYSPLQIIIMTLMFVYSFKNTFLLFGLEGPEPLNQLYNKNFYRASWILTALDAGFWTAMPIRPKILRDFLSLVFTFFYLFFPREADIKVRNFRSMITVEAMRVSWQKQLNPFLYYLSSLLRPWFGVKKKILIPRPRKDAFDDEPITAYIYFSGNEKELYNSKSIILDIPGGGFVTMPPECHESYLAYWCKETKVPIISIDYKKAPEFPYPYAIEECFDAYRTIVESKGECLGLKGLKESTINSNNEKHHTEIPVAIVGDSAGGSIATALMYKILEWEKPLARPQGLVLIYPCLDFNISCWMNSAQVNIFRSQSVKSLTSLLEAKNHYKHKSPLSTIRDTESSWRNKHYPSIEEQIRRQSYASKLNELLKKENIQAPQVETSGLNKAQTVKFDQNRGSITARSKHYPLTMTSRMTFFNDRVLTPDLMRSMAILYIGPHNRPDFTRDYYLSPLVGPEHLLAQFPKTYLICGEKDPMVDDTILFAGRIRQAKMRAQRRNNSANQVFTNGNKFNGQMPQLSMTPLTPTQESSKATKSSNHLRAGSFVIGSGDDDDDDYESTTSSDEEPLDLTNAKSMNNNNPESLKTTDLHNVEESLLGSVRSYARLYPGTPQSSKKEDMDANTCTAINDEQFGVEVKLLEGMSHAFLNMIPFLPEAMSSTKYIASWLIEILEINEKLSPK
ncbi:alpha/beta-hydrolase [Neoconidiobolus thromboides FSU 785]|nr:alpha/beta-hydrolase [Neoconidiobolus thromboides FSU 785]